MDYQPNFTVSAQAISMIAEISALIERYDIAQNTTKSLKLRRANQIQTIQSSLAIEGNTLSVKQITDIIDGKRVVAPIREIQEVKNAIAAYDLFDKLNPYASKDLLKAHKVMMAALIDAPGKFRSGGVGVFNGKNAVHIAPPAELVPGQINELFKWLKSAPDHLLIKSCVFHYEFEFIHCPARNSESIKFIEIGFASKVKFYSVSLGKRKRLCDVIIILRCIPWTCSTNT